jgi:hypothetical protein
MRSLSALTVGVLVAVLMGGLPASGQSPNDPVMPPLPPPPRPQEPAKEDREKDEDRRTAPLGQFIPESDVPWGIEQELKDRLAERARDYRNYALRFVANERVRSASYNDVGEAHKEKSTRYEYLLERDDEGTHFVESRATIKKSGKQSPASGDKHDVGFPPAYGWTFLFSGFNQPYFAYRNLGDDFEGFDWVRAIGFKGSLPWAGGKDIREWEGIALVNAVDFTLLEVRAQPSGQSDRLEAEFKRWSQSFNLLNMRTGAKPNGYRCWVALRMRKDGLTFPTQMRYDTFRAVSLKDVILTSASIREYDNYRFVGVKVEEKVQGSSPN